MPTFRKRTFATFSSNGSRFGASNGTRAFKRRRFSTRRRRIKRSGGRRTTDYTSLNTRGHAVGFRGRKTSRAAYKRHIWNSTIFKAHYRSMRTIASGFTTPATTTESRVVFFNMYDHTGTGGSPFWEAPNAREIDLGEGVPTFEDVILRGGKFELVIQNQSTNDIKLKIYRITTGNNPDFTLLPGPLTDVDQQWDPSMEPDFYSNIGKPFMAREVTIEGGNSYTFVTRFKSQKIDEVAYTAQARSPYIAVMFGNVGTSVNNALEIKRGYNLSFSADIVSPAA